LILFTECSEFKIGVEVYNGLLMCLLLLILERISDDVLGDLFLVHSSKLVKLTLISDENSESDDEHIEELSAVS